MAALHPYRIGEWAEPSATLRKHSHLPDRAYRIEDIGFDYAYTPATPCVMIKGKWFYAADFAKTLPPPPTAAEKEAAVYAAEGWRKRQDDLLREAFSEREEVTAPGRPGNRRGR